MFDIVIIGAGFSGAVMAERAANQLGKRVLILEKRPHIGGNAYDRHDEHGVLVHQYGPHIFHTKMKPVWDYLSQFTEWRLYHHQVLGAIDGKRVPIPFNLNSLQELLPASLAERLERKLADKFGYNTKVPILTLRETDDADLKWLADYVYEKVFLHYTAKQWGLRPEELGSHVTGRVPVLISRDNRYFQDAYQGMPKHGYTRMFERMLASDRIHLMLNTDYHEVLDLDVHTGAIRLFGQPYKGKLVYTGKIDELFGYEFGELPYRSLRFDFRHEAGRQQLQEVGTVNYPNDYAFTRITEFKHLTGQACAGTTYVEEYPLAYERDKPAQDIPYYPIPQEANQALYKRYAERAKPLESLILLGRLAEYTYYDMDACVAKALKVFDQKMTSR